MPTFMPRPMERIKLSAQSSRAELPFKVHGIVERALVYPFVFASITSGIIEAGIPMILDGLDLDYEGNALWDGRAAYSSKLQKGDQGDSQVGEQQASVVSFDTQGGTFNRKQFIGSPTWTTENAPNFGGAINVNDTVVEGVDVEAPGFSWTEQIFVPKESVTPEYIARLFHISQHTNQSAWTSPGLNFTFESREARFRYAQGSLKDNRQWEINYHFVAEPNTTTLSIGSIDNIHKKGQQYLWIKYRETVDQNTLVRQPQHIYVGEVYPLGEFNDLNP